MKTVRFRKPVYVGDAINTVKIFNEKEVDEIVILDISAAKNRGEPQFDRIAEIASEAFMPMAYGGAITRLDQIKRLFQLGIEKVILNSAFFIHPDLVREASDQFGAQSIVVSLDARRHWRGGYRVASHGGTKRRRMSLEVAAEQAVMAGAGEILLNSIDREGTYTGYDIALIKQVTSAVDVPVIACGGARNLSDFCEAVQVGGAAAVAAGSMFVFHGVHRAVLVNFPSEHELQEQFFDVVAPCE